MTIVIRLAGPLLVVVFAFGALAILGCGGAQSRRAPAEVKRRFAYEFGCSAESVTTVPIDTTRGYTVTMGAEGCGRRAMYVLNSQTGSWVLNSNDEPSPVPADRAAAPPVARSALEPEVAVARRDDGGVRGIRVRTRSIDTQMDYLFVPERSESTVFVQLTSRSAVALGGCESFELRAGSTLIESPIEEANRFEVPLAALLRAAEGTEPLRARFCGRAWRGTMQDSFALRRLREHGATTPTPTPTSTDVAAHVPATGSREDVIRQRLTAAGPLAHACTGTDDPIGVEAEWDEAGRVSVRVRGVEDMQVSECLRVGLGEAELPPGGSGRVVHAIP